MVNTFVELESHAIQSFQGSVGPMVNTEVGPNKLPMPSSVIYSCASGAGEAQVRPRLDRSF